MNGAVTGSAFLNLRLLQTSEASALPDERADRADNLLHGGGGKQQARDPGEQLDPAVAQYPEYCT